MDKGVRCMSAQNNSKFHDVKLSREITIVLAVKLALLLILWLVFFSGAPVSTPNAVVSAVLGPGDNSVVTGKDNEQ